MKAVIFDMDGVLVDTVEYHYLSWKKITSELGIPFSREDNDQLRGLSRRSSFKRLVGDLQISEEEMAEWLVRKNEYFMDYIRDLDSLELLPGVYDLFQELNLAGIPIGVSSSSENTKLILKKLGIREFINAVGDKNNVQYAKPHPEVFLFTAAQLNVEPSGCVVIEDGEAGVEAGQAAGMCVVGLGPESRVGEAQAVFPDLSAVTLNSLQEVYEAWRREHQTVSSYILN